MLHTQAHARHAAATMLIIPERGFHGSISRELAQRGAIGELRRPPARPPWRKVANGRRTVNRAERASSEYIAILGSGEGAGEPRLAIKSFLLSRSEQQRRVALRVARFYGPA